MSKIIKKINFYSGIGMRASFGMIMLDLVKKNKNLIVLTSDVSTSAGLDRFKSQHKNNYLEIGISEQNMIGVAAGLSNDGFQVFTSSFSPFQTLRCLEQIKVNLGYMNEKIIMVGLASGLVLGPLGFTHCSIEDIGAIRSIPNIKIISPSDGLETTKAIIASIKENSSIYIRLTGGAPAPIINKTNYNFEIGKSVNLIEGRDLAIISNGAILSECYAASEILKNKNISCKLINMHTVKPLDENTLKEVFKKFKYIFTVEEHNVIGGLGSAIAEFFSNLKTDNRLVRIGVDDLYSKSGSYHFMKKINNIDADSIVETIEREIAIND